MNLNTKFPEWIVNVANKNQAIINKESHEYFEGVKKLYPRFSEAFIVIPKNAELGVLKSHKPSEVSGYYQKDSPLEFIVFNILETFHFLFVYQVRELSQAMQECLERGKFFAASIINRSIFELVCTCYYILRRVEVQYFECMKIIIKITKTKSTVEKERLTQEYVEKLYNIYSLLQRGNNSSGIDWQKHMQKFGSAMFQTEDVQRIHINTAIEDIEKQSKMPLSKIYALMSEFVHPNYGSKTLIMKTLSKHDELMDKLTIGDNQDNEEAALFYIDQCSEGLFTNLTLALSFVDRSIRLLTTFGQAIESKNTLH